MKIPKEAAYVIGELKKNGFEGYVVGGCVRDFLLGKIADDWDITTNARPEEIQKVFSGSFYENNFFTVTAKVKGKEIEITTYRSEAKYTDKRHPDEVRFAQTLAEDLARRDFTINAMAMDIKLETRNPKSKTNTKYKIQNTKYELIDPFSGQVDIGDKTIKAVGDASERFGEDALRMMRAVRFAATLGFEIEKQTAAAIKKNAGLLRAISKERIRDELSKIIMAEKAAQGFELLRELGLLKYIIPELEQGCGISQNKHHIYECYEHALLSLGYAAKKNFNHYVRWAALLHDIAKPKTKRGQGEQATFYGHEIVGARMAIAILNRLKFSKKEVEKIAKLVRYHLFYYNVDEVTESSVRRLVRKVGPENMEELLQVRMADRIGSGVPKAEPYMLRHLKYIIEKVSKDPISVKMLKVSGEDVMRILKIDPGPQVGKILDVLLSYVLVDPKKNKKTILEKEIAKLGKLSEKELVSLAGQSIKERDNLNMKEDKMTKQKYWVT